MNVKEKVKENLCGQVFDTNRSGKCVVIEHKSNKDIVVEFYEPPYVTKCWLSQLLKGNVNNPLYPRNEGVGYFGVGPYNSKDDKRAYDIWDKLLSRCYNKSRLSKFPTYEGAVVCEEWLNFQNFAAWCYKQKHFESKDDKGRSYHLDKDILVRGNKVYSPETCSFVPPYINTMLIGCDKARGKYPRGVCYHKGKGKIVAQLRSGFGKKIHLGHFDTPEEAFEAYKVAKEVLIRETAERFKDVLDSRVYRNLMNWEVTVD